VTKVVGVRVPPPAPPLLEAGAIRFPRPPSCILRSHCALTREVSSSIIDVQRGASATGSASSQVLSSAQALTTESHRLKSKMGQFLGTVRSAWRSSDVIAISWSGSFRGPFGLGTVDLTPSLGYERQPIACGCRSGFRALDLDGRTAEIRQEFQRVLETAETISARPDAVRRPTLIRPGCRRTLSRRRLKPCRSRKRLPRG
jgi:hypothetical protein